MGTGLPTDRNSHLPTVRFEPFEGKCSRKITYWCICWKLVASDADQANNLTFSLVSGTGSEHNHFFSIDANGSLLTAVELDYEQNSTLSVRAKVQDEMGASLEAVFQIRIGKDFKQSGINGIGSGIRTESYADFSGTDLKHAKFAGGKKKGTVFRSRITNAEVNDHLTERILSGFKEPTCREKGWKERI